MLSEKIMSDENYQNSLAFPELQIRFHPNIRLRFSILTPDDIGYPLAFSWELVIRDSTTL